MKKSLILAILLPLMTSACGIYTSYERPEMPVVDSLYTNIPTEAVSNDSTSIAFLTWEELFADSLLRGYIRTGLANNTDLGIALLKVQDTLSGVTLTAKAWRMGEQFPPSCVGSRVMLFLLRRLVGLVQSAMKAKKRNDILKNVRAAAFLGSIW